MDFQDQYSSKVFGDNPVTMQGFPKLSRTVIVNDKSDDGKNESDFDFSETNGLENIGETYSESPNQESQVMGVGVTFGGNMNGDTTIRQSDPVHIVRENLEEQNKTPPCTVTKKDVGKHLPPRGNVRPNKDQKQDPEDFIEGLRSMSLDDLPTDKLNEDDLVIDHKDQISTSVTGVDVEDVVEKEGKILNENATQNASSDKPMDIDTAIPVHDDVCGGAVDGGFMGDFGFDVAGIENSLYKQPYGRDLSSDQPMNIDAVAASSDQPIDIDAEAADDDDGFGGAFDGGFMDDDDIMQSDEELFKDAPMADVSMAPPVEEAQAPASGQREDILLKAEKVATKSSSRKKARRRLSKETTRNNSQALKKKEKCQGIGENTQASGCKRKLCENMPSGKKMRYI